MYMHLVNREIPNVCQSEIGGLSGIVLILSSCMVKSAIFKCPNHHVMNNDILRLVASHLLGLSVEEIIMCDIFCSHMCEVPSVR